jgi:hypothetical protein
MPYEVIIKNDSDNPSNIGDVVFGPTSHGEAVGFIRGAQYVNDSALELGLRPVQGTPKAGTYRASRISQYATRLFFLDDLDTYAGEGFVIDVTDEELEEIEAGTPIGHLDVDESRFIPADAPMDKVFVVTYNHKHGQDVVAYSNEAAAHEGALSIVREYREDFQVDAEISDEDALVNWIEHTGYQEWIETTVCTINHSIEYGVVDKGEGN